MSQVVLREVAQVISGQHLLDGQHNTLGIGIGYLTGPSDFRALRAEISRWTEVPKVVCEPGDVLVTVKGAGVGKVNLAPETKAAIGRQIMAVRCDVNRLDADFLAAYLQTLLPYFRERAVGATVPGLSRADLEEIRFSLPPVVDQRRIAARLKAQLTEVDTARLAAQAQVRDAALLRQRLLRQVFDALQDAPVKVLGEWATTTSGVTPSRDKEAFWHPAEIAWVKTGEIDFAPIASAREFISRKALAECSLALIPPKSVLIAITGEGKTRGRSAVLEIEATTNQHSVAVLPNDTWDAEFMQLWLQASYYDLRALSEGRGGSRSALSGVQIKSLEVPAPDITTQRRIVTRLQAQLAEADTIAQAAAAQLARIDQLPQKLLAQAFNAPGGDRP